ncbi:MAG: Crp/Fnr family transcriptional regulator [Bacteroidetes bacterium]|nr:MAG: Crp/Fnr family transcriptional regulator [Bacteroidota bacterium]
MHPFRAFIQEYTPLSDSDWEAIAACIRLRKAVPGELLLEEGQVCRSLYFLESGLLRFFVWKEGVDVTKFFTEAPYTLTSTQSFNSEQPARESIEVLEESLLWEMSFEDAHLLLERRAWSTFVRKLVQEVQGYLEEILEELQTQTAENRYLQMTERNPGLLQRVSLKHLASYLGIAPQSLSRIRKNIMPGART